CDQNFVCLYINYNSLKRKAFLRLHIKQFKISPSPSPSPSREALLVTTLFLLISPLAWLLFHLFSTPGFSHGP
ncbi:hypothetical protein OFB74_35090, partial [Escherichia coli]|nr:hypothetical protein [Escherichia coli]